MTTRLIFCFDGTSNKPEDSVQDHNLISIDDKSITNVLKLHLLLGGDMKDGAHIDGQRSFYFSGIGTRGSRLEQIFDKAFALPRLSLNAMLEEASTLVERHYKDGDEVFLFGFSRGAATARRFACKLPAGVQVRFMGVFDTVASFGKPNLKTDSDPRSDVLFENGTIAASVQEAVHLVAIDETRLVFRPTLMNRDDRVTEIWMPGVHSDVGGGYRDDGLSDSALQVMLGALQQRDVGLKSMSPSAIDFNNLLPDDAEYELDLDDIVIEPDHFSTMHSHERTPRLSDATLATRRVCVNVNDSPGDDAPLIHWTAAERIYGDRTYRPEALKSVPHTLLLPDGGSQAFDGLSDHLRRGVRQLTHLEVGEERQLLCHALRTQNRNGVAIVAGHKYIFTVPAGERWTDKTITCGPEGWTRDDIQEGFLKEAAIAASEFLRRSPNSNWFALMGSVGPDDGELFEILRHTSQPFVAATSGELCSFANDIDRLYSNNSGSIRFTIKRVG